MFGERASDKFILEYSKILDKCQPGDAIMVDKGFQIGYKLDQAAGINIRVVTKYSPLSSYTKTQRIFVAIVVWEMQSCWIILHNSDKRQIFTTGKTNYGNEEN